MESQADDGPLQPLRIAIVLDSVRTFAWIAGVIESILRVRALQAAVILPPRNFHAEYSYLFRRYLSWDARNSQPGPDPLASVDVSEMLANVPTVEMASLDAELDVLLWLSAASPVHFPFATTRYGTWFIQHDAAEISLPWAAYFPELASQSPVASSYLAAMKRPAGPTIKLQEAHTASEIGWSLARHRVAPFWKAATLPAAALNSVLRESEPSAGVVDVSLTRSPSNGSVLAFAVRNTIRTANRRFRYANQEAHWFVAYRTKGDDFVTRTGRFTKAGFQTLPSPEDHFYADPFVLTWQKRTFLFVEDYLYAEGRGVLSVLEFQADGRFGPAREILNRPYHLSYPFVFEHEGEVYLIPETMAACRIELYRAVEMPHRWELVKVLQEDVEAVDTTLWIEDGIFYFFTNIVQPGLTPNDLLYLFTAESLTGEWRSHPANPVSRDVRGARGAGKLFRAGDKLVRPAQDCSVRYGYATQLNRVEVLTRKDFREKPLLRIEPDWAPKLIGTHTINSNDAVEVIDGQMYRTRYRRRAKEF